MELINEEKLFIDKMSHVSLKKDFLNGTKIFLDISILSEKFIEYQRQLIDEFYSVLVESLQNQESIDINDFKNFFEEELHGFNSKLNLFAERINDVDNFELRGIIQIFIGDCYLASMIGQVSIVVYRNEKLCYLIDNEIQQGTKIDNFSDFIEGDLENNDSILVCGFTISNIFEKKELDEAIFVSKSDDKKLSETIEDLAKIRIKQEEICFLNHFDVKIERMILKEEIKENIIKKFSNLYFIHEFILKNKYSIVISIATILIFYLMYAFLLRSNISSDIIQNDGKVYISNITIDDIKKDLDIFKKIGADSDEKGKKYNEILEKIDILEKQNKRPHDIKQLKEFLNMDYYKGFNIALINNLDTSTTSIYKFDESELVKIGEPTGIDFYDNLVVQGKKGSLFGIVNNENRAKSIEYNIPNTIIGCNKNLLENGMYCFSDTSDIFNITNSGIESVTTKSGKFQNGIYDIDKFKDTSIYVFSNEGLNSNDGFITRYSNIVGSQTSFGEGMKYNLQKEFFEQNKENFSSGFSDFIIDINFLAWSKKDKGLYQFWRDGNIMNGRNIKISGGDKNIQFGENIKILTKDNSKFLILFDKDNQYISVFGTNPYKTNSSYYKSYNLTYLFSIKFDIPNLKIIDAYVQFGDKMTLFLLTNSSVFRLKLDDFFQSFLNN